MNPYLILMIGLLLIFLEFFLPGAVIGSIGGLFVLASIWVFATTTDSLLAIFLYVIAIFFLLFFLVKFSLWRIKRTKSASSIYSDDAQEGFVAASFDKQAIGKKAIVISDLKPGGYILFEGKKLQALSVGGYIVRGTEVLIIDGQEESLLVKPL